GLAYVEVAGLIDVERGDLARRRVAFADDAVAFHEAGDDVVGVAVAEVGGDDGGDLLRGRRRGNDGGGGGSSQGGGGDGGEEGAAVGVHGKETPGAEATARGALCATAEQKGKEKRPEAPRRNV